MQYEDLTGLFIEEPGEAFQLLTLTPLGNNTHDQQGHPQVAIVTKSHHVFHFDLRKKPDYIS